MFKVENLSKIYNKQDKSVKALDGINFTLEDTGFVFIVGKSGSGKSTLLNMIGGLDNATCGDIFCENLPLSKFSPTDFDNYRNTYLGFIFQDYCLIEDLNVRENIILALNLKGDDLNSDEKDKLVDEVLTSVDLDLSLKNRYVKELSGGQKQRVAIARALIKSPKLILADEPTGNLDSKTSTKILKLLKKLSKDRLVVIVSHNLEDAKNYANRIIELSDGKIISDTTRQNEISDTMTLNRGILTLPNSTTLTSKQLKEINNKLKNNKIKKIKQKGTGFRKTREIKVEPKEISLEHKKMTYKNSLKLSSFFLKKRRFASIFTITIISLLIFVLGICQFFMQFNAANTVYSVLSQNNEEDILLYNGYYNEDDEIIKNKYIEISDEQIEEFEKSDYTGNIFKLYLNPFCFSETYSEYGEIVPQWSYNNYYVNETRGTLACNEDYLIKRFGKNNKLEYIGNLKDKNYGIIITDYIADSIIYSEPETFTDYDSILGEYLFDRRYINAIISTDYKEKYASLFEYLTDTALGVDRSSEKEHFRSLLWQYTLEVQKYYGIAYSIEKDYGNIISTSTPFVHTVLNYGEFKVNNISLSFNNFFVYQDRTFNAIYSKNNNTSTQNKIALKDFSNTKIPLQPKTLPKTSTETYTLGDYEIAMELDIFNNIFGKIYGTYTTENFNDFQPITLTLNKFDGTDNKNIVYSQEVTIAKLLPSDYIEWTNKEHRAMFAGEKLVSLINQNSQYCYGLYFDDASQLDKIYNTINSNPYIVQSRVYNSVKSVGDIVSIFEDLFGLILIGIGSVCLTLLANYAYGNIKKRYYEIGVLKSLGATTKNVGFIFSLQTLIAGISICILSTISLLVFSKPINNLISSKLIWFINNDNVQSLTILKADTLTLIVNIFIITIVTILSCLLPLIKLNKIKPKNIIANKE